MITQHETFRQAATKALESLANKVFDLIGQQVSKWLAGELAKTAATVSGEAARTAAQSAGSAASIAPMIANAGKAISFFRFASALSLLIEVERPRAHWRKC